MRYDVHPPLGHPEAAGWVLGALDGAEAEAFGEHLLSCGQCRASASEFEAVARALDRPVPADEPPPGLEARVLAAVQLAAVQLAAARQAAMAPARPEAPAESTWQSIEAWQVVDASQTDRPARLEEIPRRQGIPRPAGARPRPAGRPTGRPGRLPEGRLGSRLLLAAAAVAVAVAVAAGVSVAELGNFRGAGPTAASVSLSAQAGATGSGTATVRQAPGGWAVQLTEHDLKKLPAGQFYECWYVGPANRPGHRQLITAGTFTVDHSGNEVVTLSSAADPRRFKIMEITAESPGDGGQHGKVVLKGAVRGG